MRHSGCAAAAAGPLANTHNASRGRAGPAAMGQQKRTGYKQFFSINQTALGFLIFIF
jgi:hypothetical protein